MILEMSRADKAEMDVFNAGIIFCLDDLESGMASDVDTAEDDEEDEEGSTDAAAVVVDDIVVVVVVVVVVGVVVVAD